MRSDVLASVFTRAFRGNFFFKFSWKKIVMGKKDRCAVFGCNNDRLLPINNHWRSHFSQNACVNTERVPPEHPIIILISNKFKTIQYSRRIGKKVYQNGTATHNIGNGGHLCFINDLLFHTLMTTINNTLLVLKQWQDARIKSSLLDHLKNDDWAQKTSRTSRFIMLYMSFRLVYQEIFEP